MTCFPFFIINNIGMPFFFLNNVSFTSSLFMQPFSTRSEPEKKPTKKQQKNTLENITDTEI